MNKPATIRTAEFNPRIRKYIFAYVALIILITLVGIPLLLLWVCGIGQAISKKYFENLSCKLTEVHLEYKKGVLFKVEKTIPLENIQDLTFIENPILNYFGLKILKIETAGNGGSPNKADMKLIGIIDAHEFKEAVLRQREKLKSNPQNNEAGDVVEVLKEIKTLLEEIKNK